MATSNILQFVPNDTGTNLLTDAAYLAASDRSNGNQPGVASSKLNNKALRQASAIAAGVAQYIADRQATNVTDALTPAQIAAMLALAAQGQMVRVSVYSRVAGVQNVSVNGAANTTTGASTFTSLTQTKFIRVRVQAGGSSGGGAAATGAGQYAAGLGGMGGSYGESIFTSGFSGGLAVSAGLGGAAPAAGNTAGIAGGASSLGVLISAPGGVAPAAAGPANALANGSVVDNGPNGLPSGANVIARVGQGGGFRFYLSTGQFIGSRGGTAGDGGTGGGMTNNGGGSAGVNPGAGGSAATLGSSLAAAAGGAGGDGYVIVEEFA